MLPVADDLEHEDAYPADLVAQMQAMGLFGITIPEEHGGLGLDLHAYIAVIEELAAGWMSLSGIINTHTIAASLIMRQGTPEQQARWLPGLAQGAPRGCLSLSEPDAGSDTRNISCRARRDGEEYVISGTKTWVTNGERAGIVALAARTDEGITCFIVEKEPGPTFGGITVSKNIGKLGYKGIETVEMFYDDHRVGADCVLGGDDGLGHGLGFILGALEVGRINIAARAVGVARAAFEAAIRYAQERHDVRQADRGAPGDPAEARRHGHEAHGGAPAHRARGRPEAVGRPRRRRGRAWRSCSRARPRSRSRPRRCASTVASGYTTEFPIERYYRDAPLMIIGEGTNEIQRLVIARGLLQRYAI